MTTRARGVAPCSSAPRGTRRRLLWLLAWLVAAPEIAAAQGLPAGPFTALEGTLTVGGEVVATVGAPDNEAFFNYTDYEHNVLRMMRLALSAAWQPLGRVALVAEVRSEDFDGVRPYAAYVRVRPWASIPLDFQAGRIPPVFGAFGRRAYYADNPLIGYPLAYQYLTSLRPDAVPATLDDLLRMRGRGWQPTYPVGSQELTPGVPLVSGFRWDTGVQAHYATRRLELSGAATLGTLSDPRASDNNDGVQVSGRVAVHPVVGLTVGGSAADGAWLADDVQRLLPSPGRRYAQTAFGLDAEYSRSYWLLRTELVWSRFDVPFASTGVVEELDSLGVWIEGRYRVAPRVTVAARLDRLGFSTVERAAIGVSWDAPVTRVEGDVSYHLQRNLTLRLAVQHADRDGGRIRQRTYVSGQLAYWF
ncbi:MAG TPA: hypothetical protein VD833_05045 [Vicinamibacterales bacterium]|nr:hypothetical protein [Vicinamibacterales bacterium]